MKVLITGGAGFIGSNLSELLLSHGHFSEIRILDDLSTGSFEKRKDLDVEFEGATILDLAAVTRMAHEVDSIVYLSAIPSVPRSVAEFDSSHDANATGHLTSLRPYDTRIPLK